MGKAARTRGVSRLGLSVLGLLLSLSGCKRGDAEGCSQAQSVTRDALKSEQFDLAKQWRDRAWKLCEEAPHALDSEIVQSQTRIHERAAAEAARKKESADLVRLLAEWAGQHRASAERAAVSTECAEPQSPAEPKERWCQGTRNIVGSKHALSVRYWDDDREATRFSATPPLPATCAGLGPHRVVGAWQVAATDPTKGVTRTHCEFTGGALGGLHALVSAAENAEVFVFSTKYLEKDTGFKRLVKQ